MSAATVLTLLPLILTGEQAVVFLYGNKYHGTGLFISLLGSACALRFLRNVPVMGAMAHADTKIVMYTNISRVSGLLSAVFVVLQHFPLWTIAASAILGEVIALSVATGLLHFRHGLNFVHNIRAILLVCGWLSLGAAFVISVGHRLSLAHALLWSCSITGMALATSYFLLSGLRKAILIRKDAEVAFTI